MKWESIVDESIDELDITIRTPRLDDPGYLALVRLLDRPQSLYGKKRGSVHAIAIDEALWFESVDDKVFLYTVKDTFETAYRLYELEEWLSEYGFVRVGKSQIVCLSKIRSFRYALSGRLEATLNNGEKVIVSRSYVKSVRTKLEQMGGIRHASI